MENEDLDEIDKNSKDSDEASDPVSAPESSIEAPLPHESNPDNTTLHVTAPNKIGSKAIPVVVLSFLLVAIVGLTAFFIVNRSSDSDIALSAPNAKQVEQFCSSRGLYYALMNEGDPVYMDSKAEFSYQEEKLGVDINSEAICLAVDSNGSIIPDTDLEITGLNVYFLEKDYTGSAQIKQAVAAGTILDDSPGFLKVIGHDERGGYAYVVFCKNTILSLSAKSIEAGEKAIIELGYPERGRADDNTIEKDITSSEELVDAHNREVLVKIVDTLTNYKSSHGYLPKVEEGVQGANYGYSDREFDVFFRDYIRDQEWFRNLSGETYYTIDTASTANPERAEYEIITIHYNATCKDGEVVFYDDPERFSVTIAKTAGDGYLCVSN